MRYGVCDGSLEMRLKVYALAPCATFFAAGRTGGGLLALLLQISLVGWPLAYRMARQIGDDHAVERKLSELSAAYEVPAALRQRPRRFQAVPVKAA